MERRIQKIIEIQKEFQRLVGFPIDSILERDRNEMSEKYILKLIEEAIEARKEFPSVMNPWAKTNKQADRSKVREEFVDVFLFLVNLLNCWKISLGNFISATEEKQEINIRKVKEKQLNILNQEILAVPTYISGIGSGNPHPKYVFVGQNPGQTITHGYKVWSNKDDGSSKILLPILEELGILNACYFTNIVKSTTKSNIEPSIELFNFWKPFFDKEISILEALNSDVKFVSMGLWTSSVLKNSEKFRPINHPAFISYGGISKDEYKEQIKKALCIDN